jgi:hypothetical protein
MPQLLALDYSYNYVKSVASIVPSLIQLYHIKSLWLAGNPCSLQRRYRAVVSEDCKSLEIVDGVRVRKEEGAVVESQVKDFDQLMNVLFKEDREKAAAKAEAEKNQKKGPPGKDDKKGDKKGEKPTTVAMGTKLQLEKEKDKKEPLPILHTMGSMEFDTNVQSQFEMDPSITDPFKILLSVRTLEKVETVFFEELADDPQAKKEDYQACFWIEFDLSKV